MFIHLRLLSVVFLLSACFHTLGCGRYTKSDYSTSSSSTQNPCALPNACSVVLLWDPYDPASGTSAPTGYRAYYGPTPSGYTNSTDVGMNVTHSISNLTAGNTYYFAVTAYNSAGESPYSNEVSKTILSCCQAISVTLQLKE